MNIVRLLTACVLLLISTMPASAEEPDFGAPINWYYSAAFGTGVYHSDDVTVGVVRIPFTFTLGEETPDKWSSRLLLPVSLGFYNYDFDDILELELELPNELGTFSFLPGIEFEKYVLERWRLKPFMQFGGGFEVDGDESATIFSMGVRSLYQFKKTPRLKLGNALIYAGFDPNEGERESTSLLITGLNYTQPIPWRSFNRESHIGLDLNYYYYFKGLDFTPIFDDPFALQQEIELAVTLGWSKPINILGFPLERFGLAYRYSDNISGLKLVAGHPF